MRVEVGTFIDNLISMAKKKKEVTEDAIFEHYMQSVLDGQLAETVYRFCREMDIQEVEFYQHFGSLPSIEKRVWSKLLEKSLDIIKADDSYESSTERDKMLMLYYTFFENCTLNRSFLLWSLERHMELRDRASLLAGMREVFKNHLEEVFSHDKSTSNRMREELSNLRQKGVGEAFWAQLLFLLDFWQKDESPGFEKTDAAIEKSVQVAMNLVDTKPLESIIDFGKFLWQEKVGTK